MVVKVCGNCRFEKDCEHDCNVGNEYQFFKPNYIHLEKEISDLRKEVKRLDTLKNNKPRPKKIYSEEVEQLVQLLIELMKKNNPNARIPERLDAWREPARLLLENDKRPLQEAIAVLRFTQNDYFWKCNILSIKTFREKYDRMLLTMQNKDGKNARVDKGNRDYSSGIPDGWK